MRHGPPLSASLGLLCSCAGGAPAAVQDHEERPWADTGADLQGGLTGGSVDAVLSLRAGGDGWPEVVLVSPARVQGQGLSALNRATLPCTGDGSAGVVFLYDPSGWWLHDGEGADLSYVGGRDSAAVALETPLFSVRCEAGQPVWRAAGTLTYAGGSSFEPVLIDELAAP